MLFQNPHYDIIMIHAGSSVVLQCSGRGNPPPSIVWRKHNRYCTVLYCTILTVLHNRDLAGLDHMLRQRSGTQHSAECQAMSAHKHTSHYAGPNDLKQVYGVLVIFFVVCC